MTAMMVSSCSDIGLRNAMNMEFPSQQLQTKPTFSVANVHKSWDVETQGNQPAEALAKDFHQNGQGDVLLVVTFEKNECPKTEKANMNRAMTAVKDINAVFKRNGVSNVKGRVAPVSADKAGLAIVSYDAVTISQPLECLETPFSSVDGSREKGDMYRLGCEHARMMTQMVANKQDLLGNKNLAAKDSASLGKSMEEYNSGETVGEGKINVVTSAIGQ